MFSRDKKPQRIHMMSLGVLNLPRLPVLDWAFGHSIISCHVEPHARPIQSNTCPSPGEYRHPASKGPASLQGQATRMFQEKLSPGTNDVREA